MTQNHALAALLALTLATACNEPEAEPSANETTEQEASETAEPTEADDGPALGDQSGEGPVTLSQAGNRFDPPIPKSRVPEGAYYCDMGTVHFAALGQGDGRCPLCQMELQHMGASGEAETAEEHAEHGDEHGDHEGH